MNVADRVGRIAPLLGSFATLVLAGLISGATPADAQFYYGGYGGPPQPNRWVYGSRGSYYVPGGVVYGEPVRPRGHGGDALKTKAHNDLKKAAAPPAVKGPLLITVSISKQQLTLYDNGVPIAHSPVSTGTASHPTPTGVFSIIQKARFHRSNLYSSAPMPFMQRITWSGVALHAGQLPGYPASHGCIRLPYEFAIRLFGTTKMGARVIIAREELAPMEIAHARLFVPKAKVDPAKPDPAKPDAAAVPMAAAAPAKDEAKAETKPPVEVPAPAASLAGTDTASEMKKADGAEAAPASEAVASAAAAVKDEPKAPPANAESAKAEAAPSTLKIAELRPGVSSDAPRLVPERALRPGPVSVFVSRKEKRLFVRKGFEPVFEAPVEIADADRPLGTHIFTAMALGEQGAPARWSVVTMPAERARVKRAEPDRRGKRADRAKVVEVAVVDVQPATTASEALDRITMPKEAVDRISELMSIGASLVISDQGLGPETGLETDFVVLTR